LLLLLLLKNLLLLHLQPAVAGAGPHTGLEWSFHILTQATLLCFSRFRLCLFAQRLPAGSLKSWTCAGRVLGTSGMVVDGQQEKSKRSLLDRSTA
jgi:hypothetical protein